MIEKDDVNILPTVFKATFIMIVFVLPMGYVFFDNWRWIIYRAIATTIDLLM